jgi:ABC-type glycerol-3-phosphate transport system permease component
VNSILLAILNLVCAVLGYSWLGYAIARFHWRDRGMLFVCFAILVCAQAWWVPQLVATLALRTSEYHAALQFADWLVTGFAIPLFWMLFRNQSTACFDGARLDGLNSLGIWFHVVLPRIAILLAFLAILTALATWDSTIGIFVRSIGPYTTRLSATSTTIGKTLGFVAIISLIAAIPLIGISLLANKLIPASRNIDRS